MTNGVAIIGSVLTRSGVSKESPRWKWGRRRLRRGSGRRGGVGVGMVGLSGISFTKVFNACAIAASAAKVCAARYPVG